MMTPEVGSFIAWDGETIMAFGGWLVCWAGMQWIMSYQLTQLEFSVVAQTGGKQMQVIANASKQLLQTFALNKTE